MTGAAHVREARRLLDSVTVAPTTPTLTLAAAHVHATLALTAATALSQPIVVPDGDDMIGQAGLSADELFEWEQAFDDHRDRLDLHAFEDLKAKAAQYRDDCIVAEQMSDRYSDELRDLRVKHAAVVAERDDLVRRYANLGREVAVQRQAVEKVVAERDRGRKLLDLLSNERLSEGGKVPGESRKRLSRRVDNAMAILDPDSPAAPAQDWQAREKALDVLRGES